MHIKASPKSVFVLSKVLKRALVSYESAKSALLLSKVLTQQKRGWSLVVDRTYIQWQFYSTMHFGVW